jgi:uncharacterized protein (DUF2141 family)
MQKLLLIILIILVHMMGLSQSYELTVNIIGINEIKGSLRIAIFSNPENFKDKVNPADSAVIEVTSNTTSHTFKLNQDIYAIAVYHDENNDKQLNKRSLGIPTEGIGFSNLTSKRKRPPIFEESSFSLATDTTVQIPLFYNKE